MAWLCAIGAVLLLLASAVFVDGQLGDAGHDESWLLATNFGKFVVVIVSALLSSAVLLLAFVFWQRRGSSHPVGRVIIPITLGLLSGMAVALGVLIGIFVFGSILDPRDDVKPDSIDHAKRVFALILLAMVVVIGGSMILWWRRVRILMSPFPFLVTAAFLAVVLGPALLTSMVRDVPKAETAQAATDREAIEANITLPHDVIVVIDPGERAGRDLIRMARDPKRNGDITDPRKDVLPWSVATAIATPAPGRAFEPPELTVSPQTLRDTLRKTSLRNRPASARAQGLVLRVLMNRRASWWRPRTVASVVLVFDTLPAVLPPGRSAAAGTWTGVLESLPLIAAQTMPVRRRTVALHVVAKHGSPTRRDRWRAWTERSAGSLTLPSRFPTDRQVIDRAQDAATNRADTEEHRLAVEYRPYLKFHRNGRRAKNPELYRPLDVDHYLRSPTGGSKPARLCDKERLEDQCTDFDDAQDLQPGYDYMALPEGGNPEPDIDRTGRSLERDYRGAQRERIYYHAQEDRELLHLDYWWFFRFNASPFARNIMCLRGLAISDATCFDHEGDWEGITVTLERIDEGKRHVWHPRSVVYAGHKWQYRYDWDLLDGLHVIADETHPVVFVARGSHASYPAACTKQSVTDSRSCRQLGNKLPDGKRDGQAQWQYNEHCAACVLELPTDQYGRPARWNAYGGLWGQAACTQGLKLCVRAAGPPSPAFQKRYQHPGVGEPGCVADLRARVRGGDRKGSCKTKKAS